MTATVSQNKNTREPLILFPDKVVLKIHEDLANLDARDLYINGIASMGSQLLF